MDSGTTSDGRRNLCVWSVEFSIQIVLALSPSSRIRCLLVFNSLVVGSSSLFLGSNCILLCTNLYMS